MSAEFSPPPWWPPWMLTEFERYFEPYLQSACGLAFDQGARPEPRRRQSEPFGLDPADDPLARAYHQIELLQNQLATVQDELKTAQQANAELVRLLTKAGLERGEPEKAPAQTEGVCAKCGHVRSKHTAKGCGVVGRWFGCLCSG